MPNPTPGAPFSEKYGIISELGRGSSGITYRAIEPATSRLLILKHIPIPVSDAQVQALIFSGAANDEEEVQRYYERTLSDLRDELRLGMKFADSPYYLPFRDCQAEIRENAVGYDLYLIADFCQTLPTFLENREITVLDALNLGLDLCSCVQGLNEGGVIHSNIKPENIYRTSTGSFVLGDLGLMQISELPYTALPDSRFGPYTAPEYADILAPLNVTAQLYSIGMILYRIFNGSHVPFVDEETTPSAADAMRVEGKELPAPMYADYELSAIILKACAFKPEDRYQSADEFRQELTLYMKRNEISSAPIVPPIISDPEEIISPEQEEEDDGLINFASIEDLDESFIEHFAPISANAEEDDPFYVSEEDLRSYDMLEHEQPQLITPPPRRKKKKVWPFVLLALLVLAAVGGWLFLRGSAVTVSAMGTTEKTVDSLTVFIECDAEDESLQVVCADAYGNVFTLPYSGSTYTFTDLTPGTSYTIALKAADRTKIEGTASIQAATEALTQIISFTAGSITGTTAELSLVVNGPEPESWTVNYTADDGTSGSFVCSTHNLSLQDLIPNTTYTFTLSTGAEYVVEGETSCSFKTGAYAELLNVEALEITMQTITLGWEYEGATDMWTVVCTGSDDSVVTIETAENTAVFSDLTPGVDYTFTLDCTGLQPTSLSTYSASTPTGYIPSLTVDAIDTTTVSLSWEYEGEPIGEEWMIIYSVGTQEPIRSVVTTAEQSLTLSGLIPNSEYTFKITTASGAAVEGESSATIVMPETETFDELGLSNVFVGLFPKPEAENWTYRDLINGRSEFLPTESIVFAVQAIYGVQASDSETQALYVIRNENGEPIHISSQTFSWNDMWANNLHVGALEFTPQAVGTYRLEIHFNGQLLRGKEFQIVSALSE